MNSAAASTFSRGIGAFSRSTRMLDAERKSTNALHRPSSIRPHAPSAVRYLGAIASAEAVTKARSASDGWPHAHSAAAAAFGSAAALA